MSGRRTPERVPPYRPMPLQLSLCQDSSDVSINDEPPVICGRRCANTGEHARRRRGISVRPPQPHHCFRGFCPKCGWCPLLQVCPRGTQTTQSSPKRKRHVSLPFNCLANIHASCSSRVRIRIAFADVSIAVAIYCPSFPRTRLRRPDLGLGPASSP